MHIFILTEMNVKCSPLLRTGMEITSFDMQVPGANCLGSKSIKQSHLCSGGNAYCRGKNSSCLHDWRGRGKRRDLYMVNYDYSLL